MQQPRTGTGLLEPPAPSQTTHESLTRAETKHGSLAGGRYPFAFTYVRPGNAYSLAIGSHGDVINGELRALRGLLYTTTVGRFMLTAPRRFGGKIEFVNENGVYLPVLQLQGRPSQLICGPKDAPHAHGEMNEDYYQSIQRAAMQRSPEIFAYIDGLYRASNDYGQYLPFDDSIIPPAYRTLARIAL